MSSNGYIKLYRKTLENPIIMKDSEHLAVWTYLLMEATHKEIPNLFKGKKIMLQPGQLITGTKSIGENLKIHYVKVHRILSEFESEKQIEKQTSNKNSLISIVKWNDYQVNENQNETQMKSNCKATEKQLKTNNNNKNIRNKEIKESIKKVFTKPTLQEITDYCVERNNNVDAERFYNFYESKDWYVGKNKMKDWKACIRTWEQRDKVDVPGWFGKEIKERERTEDEERELQELIRGY